MGISPYHIDRGSWTLLRSLEHRRYLLVRRPGLVPAGLIAGRIHSRGSGVCDQPRRVPEANKASECQSILARIGPAVWPYQATAADLSTACPGQSPYNPSVIISGDMPYTPHRMSGNFHQPKPVYANADKVGKVLDVLA